MKRIISILLILLLLVACVPTPEQAFVVNKGDGALETLIDETTPVPSYEGSQATLKEQLGVPKSVQEDFTTQVYGGTLDVSVDAEVIVPEVKTVPVFSAAIGWDAMKDRTEIVHALLGDEVSRVDSARAAVLGAEADIAHCTDRLAELDAGIRHSEVLSPEEERESVQNNLSAYWQRLRMYRDKAGEPTPWDGSFIPYDSDYGTVFLYSEPYLLSFLEQDVFRIVTFYDLTADAPYIGLGQGSIAENAEAVDAALSFFSKLTDLTADVYALDTSWQGTAILLTPIRADVPCLPLVYDNGDDTGYDAVHGQAYVRHFNPESIELGVKDGRVVYLNWESPLYITGTENENVVLKPFSEIMEIFRSHIRTAYYLNYDERTGEEAHAQICITSIRFSYARVDRKNSDRFYLLPVWDFCGYDQYVDWSDDPAINAELNAQMKPLGWRSTFLTINAIDGSIIDRNLGY